MADSDVKLLDGQVKVEAWDLCLDSQDRRENDTTHRRALVHDYGDRLTLNWGGDYPKGVKIQGNTEIAGNLSVNGEVDGTLKLHVIEAGDSVLGKSMSIMAEGFMLIQGKNALSLTGKQIHFGTQDIILDNSKVQEPAAEPGESNNIALSHSDGDKLVINRGDGYKGGVDIEGNVHVSGNLSSKKSYFSEIQLGFDNRLTPAHEQYITINSSSITVHNVKYDGTAESGSTGDYISNNHHNFRSTKLDLVKEVVKMRDEINELKRKIKALESA
ncbi:MAG: hypothetical protein D3904_00635 [Candidatus Electrothrix sp. EH2]|nr:hypothetical protein [Candidatus Electrothrix sp. EH2]